MKVLIDSELFKLPKCCGECKFHQTRYWHPFWNKIKPNTHGFICELDINKTLYETECHNKTFKADNCPLKEVKS